MTRGGVWPACRQWRWRSRGRLRGGSWAVPCLRKGRPARCRARRRRRPASGRPSSRCARRAECSASWSPRSAGHSLAKLERGLLPVMAPRHWPHLDAGWGPSTRMDLSKLHQPRPLLRRRPAQGVPRRRRWRALRRRGPHRPRTRTRRDPRRQTSGGSRGSRSRCLHSGPLVTLDMCSGRLRVWLCMSPSSCLQVHQCSKSPQQGDGPVTSRQVRRVRQSLCACAASCHEQARVN